MSQATQSATVKAESNPFLHDQRKRRIVGDVLSHLLLVVLAVIWIIPIAWVVMESFNANPGPYNPSFFPEEYTLDNYIQLFTDTHILNFPKMFMHTFIIAVISCLINVFFVLCVAFSMSRLRFRFRKSFMNVVLVLGMFPNIMSVVVIYFILKSLGLTQGIGVTVALILVYSAGAGAGFYVMKGYMDTIPMSLDEAAALDGCTRWQTFRLIILPVCKPMLVYQALTAFLGPWLDFVMAKAICRTQDNYTVALGLYQMLSREYVNSWFARFAAAAVIIAIPIAILTIVMQRYYQEAMSGAVKG
ncbi:ABC transporter permease subunit [Bifidobacterium pullorum subsp. gallinarum]|uniref:ABC transporter permease subunit n=1 Tax=Bifidobacterium pullorum subsp. gallinarum TaxID=78344 RepID=A0A4P6DQZ3_9BIFI|nr:ABC transporter permease subunit [Bifidobacterium pullorum]QAY32006.1 ABC transporter permease subunit [Bifidobacterium pullorum subsp. gallinarum]